MADCVVITHGNLVDKLGNDKALGGGRGASCTHGVNISVWCCPLESHDA
jgi:hypothetical protein